MELRQIQQLAELAHSEYAALHAEGTGSLPWSELSATDREANLDSARFTPVLLEALGIAIVAGGDPRARTSLTEDELEAGARLEHLRWCRFTRRIGRTDHVDLVPWAELDEPTRELDRIRVRRLPAILAQLGLAMVDDDACG